MSTTVVPARRTTRRCGRGLHECIECVVYLQDEIYFPNSDFTLTAGLRFEWFTSDDTPNFNQALSDAIGIRNDNGLDGLNVLMPRVGFNWGMRDDLTLARRCWPVLGRQPERLAVERLE